MQHFDNMAKIMLVTGTMVGYAYAMEFFIAWYSRQPLRAVRVHQPRLRALRLGLLDDGHLQRARRRSSSGSRRCARACWCCSSLSIFVNIGMWFERFVIIVTSLHRDFLPSSWGYFRPTMWDIATCIGSFGLFFTMFCLFVRFLPMVATAEVKTVLPQADPHAEHDARVAPTVAGRLAPKGAH